jgi:hypothetical protein
MLDQGWARFRAESDSWRLVATGWEVALEAWPIALGGSILGAGIVWVLGVWSGARTAAFALSEDRRVHEEKVAGWERLRMDELSSINRKLQAVHAARETIEGRERAANDRASAAETRAEEAQSQLRNAIAATHRRRGQVEKLRSLVAKQDRELQELRTLAQQLSARRETTMDCLEELWEEPPDDSQEGEDNGTASDDPNFGLNNGPLNPDISILSER